MEFDEIIERILLERRDLTRERVLELIEGKKREAEGYFTDEGAARMVASELGVDIPLAPFRPKILIRDLVSGLNDVTVTGRVIILYPPRTFTRPDGAQGRIARSFIADRSGTLKVALWDNHANLIEEGTLEQGQIIKISHGYVREGLDGGLELHVGLRGSVQVSPPEATDREYPPITRFLQRIEEVTGRSRKASVVGVVERVRPVSLFKRRDGTGGKVRRLQLGDETGRITAVIWNNKVDELGDVAEGDYLRVMDARVRESPDGPLELHVGNTTQIEILEERPAHFKPPSKFTKIGGLKPGIRDVDVLARVAHAGGVREFPRRRGGVGRVSSLLLKDETGFVRLNLWDEKAVLSERIRPGDVVLVEGAYARERFGEINLNLGDRGALTLNPEIPEAEELPPHEEGATKIAEVEEGGPFTVEGALTSTPTVREVTTARGERVAVASFELADETGEIRVSMWRGLVDTIKDLNPGARIRIRNTYGRRGLANRLELTSRMVTSIETLSIPDTTKGAFQDQSR